MVGTRGRNLSGMQSLLPGSVSKYCLQQSPIPVIVVRPSTKREKKKKKRMADPTRRSYNHILEMSERRGSHIFNPSSSADNSASQLPDEEVAVAKALGLPAPYTTSRSSLSFSDRSSTDDLASLNAEILNSSSGESLDNTVTKTDEPQSDSQAIPDESHDHSQNATPRIGARSPDIETEAVPGADTVDIPVRTIDSSEDSATKE